MVSDSFTTTETCCPHSVHLRGREVASIIDDLGEERISGLKCHGATKHVVGA